MGAVGMVLACFMFAFDSATQVTVNTRLTVDAATGQTVKYYDVHGILFFGSCAHFLSLFDEKNDPEDVRLVFEAGYIVDYSAIEALNKLGERYGAYKKKVTLQELKPQSASIVQKSSGLLVKELTVRLVEEEVLPAEREHLNVERFDLAEHPAEHGSEEEEDESEEHRAEQTPHRV